MVFQANAAAAGIDWKCTPKWTPNPAVVAVAVTLKKGRQKIRTLWKVTKRCAHCTMSAAMDELGASKYCVPYNLARYAQRVVHFAAKRQFMRTSEIFTAFSAAFSAETV